MTPIERAARALALRNDGRGARWDVWVGDVHAVLTAIREPSEAMLDAHIAAKDMHEDREGQAYVVWHAMIDAAMGE